jgi:hypothetical protein
LYVKAYKAGGENPVVMRAFAIFTLASCEEPRELNLKRCNDICRMAELKDPGYER